MGPCDLEVVLSRLPDTAHPMLISSIREGEDAAIYKLSEDLVIIQTLDFFPPIVDSPRAFGNIAAANALSDIYAKGGRPLTALNIVAFPCELPLEILSEILLGGFEKVEEANALLVGGHTIDDPEPKYGLSVTGIAHPDELMRIEGAKPGDIVIITKPLGTGILTTALKAGFQTENEIQGAIESMRTLNRQASDILKSCGANACTDVTGFGLSGHLHEMLKSSGVSAEIWLGELPVFEKALELAREGMLPGGLFRNREHTEQFTRIEKGLDPILIDLFNDPQTSGGLLAAVPENNAETALARLNKSGSPGARAIGVILEDSSTMMHLKGGKTYAN